MAKREFFSDVTLYGDLSWGIRGDNSDSGIISALSTQNISSMYFSGSSPQLCGLVNGNEENEKIIFIFYTGSGTLQLVHASGSSSAHNRLKLPYDSDITIYPNESVGLFYDSVEYRWKLLGKSWKYLPEIVSTGEATLNEVKVRSVSPLNSSSGDLHDVDISSQSIVRFSAAASVSGFGGTPNDDGKLLFVQNINSSILYVKNNSLLSNSANRILTGTGLDVEVFPEAAILLQYDGSAGVWRVLSNTKRNSESFSIYSYGNVSSSRTLDLSLLDSGGGAFSHTNLSSSTITLSNGIPGKKYKLFGISNGVQYSLSGVLFPQGIQPFISGSAKTDIFYLECVAENVFLCTYVFNYNLGNISGSQKVWV